MLDTLPQLTLALALAALFGAAVLHKLRAHQHWPAVVRQYRLLPAALDVPVALLLPLGEALVAAGLLWSRGRAAAAIGAAALLLLYTCALTITICAAGAARSTAAASDRVGARASRRG